MARNYCVNSVRPTATVVRSTATVVRLYAPVSYIVAPCLPVYHLYDFPIGLRIVFFCITVSMRVCHAETIKLT